MISGRSAPLTCKPVRPLVRLTCSEGRLPCLASRLSGSLGPGCGVSQRRGTPAARPPQERWARSVVWVNELPPDKVLIDRSVIECVLLDHHSEYSGPPGEQDTSLAELAHVYQETTGFDAGEEWAKDGAQR